MRIAGEESRHCGRPGRIAYVSLTQNLYAVDFRPGAFADWQGPESIQEWASYLAYQLEIVEPSEELVTLWLEWAITR